ncbi:hypothetical protein [Tumebacillus lipolyticus]|uniref:Uncharacterized protein n=1 Tax=Tumebacillus lipolyticus TaxID=1280370 RepID=A0ABW4ZVZ1_9BACL
MTNQEIKLNEARYQFSEMVKWSNERKITELQYAMSAFASAARSVIQYTFESAKLLGVVHTVYDELVNSSTSFCYAPGRLQFSSVVKQRMMIRRGANGCLSLSVRRMIDQVCQKRGKW